MAGKWLYFALAALAGVLLSIELHAVSLFFLLFVLIRIKVERNKRLLFTFCFIVLLFFLVSHMKERALVSQFQAGSAKLQVTFTHFPQIDGNVLKSTITSGNEKFVLTYIIRSEYEKEILSSRLLAGSSCFVSGQLIIPEPNRNQHAFNYQQYLRRQNIHWIFEPTEMNFEFCENHHEKILFKLRNIRAQGIRKIEAAFPKEMIPYANALIFGDRTAFTEDTYNAYRQLGVVHLLAISGLHIGIIAGGLHFFLLRIGITRETVFWILISILPIYAVLSGGNPPVVRAVTMSIILISSKKWRMPLTTLDALSLSFILFIFIDPYLIYHAGFQLSFAVSFGLIISSAQVMKRKTSFMKQMAELSIISLLSSFSILAFHFYEFSIISIAANILFVPFYSFIVLPMVFILFIFLFLHEALFLVFANWCSKLIFLSEKAAILFGSLHYSMILTGKPGKISLFFMLTGTIIFFIMRERKKGLLISAVPLIFVLFIHSLFVTYSPKGEVIFIDIGQGDSILIKLPYNRGVYLIDTGGRITFPVSEWEERQKNFEVGEDIVIPLLKSIGIKRIDKLILTHSDVDHMGAAIELLGKLKIVEINIAPNSWEKPLMTQFLRSAQTVGIPVKTVKASYSWKNKSGEFHFIFPFDDHYQNNDSSLVLYAAFGGFSWLFTGDVEKAGEEELLKSYQSLRADVLKVGHHGSRTSTSESFVKSVNPSYGVISAGNNNRYGHPHSEVIETLYQNRVHVYRTDIHGAVHYIFTRNEGTFKTILQYDIKTP